jgi:hypothetical protein
MQSVDAGERMERAWKEREGWGIAGDEMGENEE